MTIKRIAIIIMIIGCLNWGLIGLFNFNLIALITDGITPIITRCCYVIIGTAGLLYLIKLIFKDQDNHQDIEFDD